MIIGVPKEIMAGERRVALVPERVAYLVGKGHQVLIETGAGAAAFFDDGSYTRAGAQIALDPRTLYAGVDLVLKVRAPAFDPDSEADEIDLLRQGAVLVALLDPLAAPNRMGRLAARGVTSFSLDVIPRITRAQSMDVLSSMATVAGYRAALIGATQLGKFFPLLMTAGGTVVPARVLVLGAGVAGLQAIATARRLGAVVQAFDTRPLVREQVESLGAGFLTLALDVGDAQDAGGYARGLAEEAYAAERDLLREPVRQADVIITTATIPGGRAPVLLSAEMVASMRPGSVIVDLAAAGGGNCELSVPGERIVSGGVIIEAPTNLPASMPVHASQLFARNAVAFVTHLLDHGLTPSAQGGSFDLTLDDEIVRETCITYSSEVLHRATRERMSARKEAVAANE
ncbi:MAG TPA: Re/Si-specific NAD(P)(+) transhydrogenase subunit alpha [Chloroflexota bacterium]|nr:Re/Si-specific NAD(P)(+) transhydrogenase subunit alpha [Chloroflexota bacterium]